MAARKPDTKKAAGKKAQAAKTPAAAKKAAAKKPVAAKAPAKARSKAQADMIREIFEIAERVDESGLVLLLNAARAVETKGKIETFNRELNAVALKAASKRREASVPAYRVDIERTKDDFFIIVLDQARVFFNRQEMREITRLCHAARSPEDGARRMFRWFEKERSDLLVDAGINSERNPYLTDLYALIIETYKVKGS